MTNIGMLVACLLIGLIMRRTRRMPENGHVAINIFIINVALPALILSQIHGLHLTADLLFPVLMPWMLFALSAAVFAGLGRALRFPAAVTGALIMTAGLANTSFVGLPMIETFYGVANLPTGIMIDQLGSYLVLSTLGITVACIYSASSMELPGLLRRVVTFPPLIALVVALALSEVPYPEWVSGVFRRLGDTVAPLALVAVGLQLRVDELRGNRVPLGLGLGFKLVLAPLLLAAVCFGVLQWHDDTSRVTVFEAAMGPQIAGSVVAMQYGMNPALVTLMVGVGIALSFLTLPLWYFGMTLV